MRQSVDDGALSHRPRAQSETLRVRVRTAAYTGDKISKLHRKLPPSRDIDLVALYGPSQGDFTRSVENGSSGGVHAHGSEVTVSANPAPFGYQFDGWSGEIANLADASAATTTLYMPPRDLTIRATYRAGDTPPPVGIPTLSGWSLALLFALLPWLAHRGRRRC